MTCFRNTSWWPWLWKVSLGWKKVGVLYRPPSWYIWSYFELDDASRAIRNRFNIYSTGNWTVVCRGFSTGTITVCHISPFSKTWSYTNWYIFEWNFILSAWVSIPKTQYLWKNRNYIVFKGWIYQGIFTNWRSLIRRRGSYRLLDLTSSTLEFIWVSWKLGSSNLKNTISS